MGRVIFIMGGQLHLLIKIILPIIIHCFSQVGKALDYYGQGDFHYGRSTSPFLGRLHFWGGKSSGLLWAVMTFIMGGQLHLSRGDCISGGGKKQWIIMGSVTFIMGGQLHLSRGDCISGVEKAVDYYGQ